MLVYIHAYVCVCVFLISWETSGSSFYLTQLNRNLNIDSCKSSYNFFYFSIFLFFFFFRWKKISHLKKNLPFQIFMCLTACRILVSQPGIKPMPLAVEAQSSNHWTTREFL